ncbi:T3SS (YopN, CesT) and YbjN peptide-binding chaperone 1 [Nocardioides marinquilinus]
MGESDFDEATEAAWRGFRQRLADRLERLADGDELVLRSAWGSVFLVRQADEVAVLSAGLLDDEGAPEMVSHLPLERVDQTAATTVEVLRHRHDAVHPALLEVGAPEVDPGLEAPVDAVDAPVTRGSGATDDYDDVAMPESHEHLHALVLDAMRRVFPRLRVDEDGDVPVRAGQSMVFVKVLRDRPSVELFAEIAHGVPDEAGLLRELAILNRSEGPFTFLRHDDVVTMRYELLALPFSGGLLRLLVRRFVDEVDRIATDLVARVGGARFLDEPEAEADDEPQPAPAESGADDGALALVGLLELLHLGRPRAQVVAELFDHDRVLLLGTLTLVREELVHLDGHHSETVLDALRRGLRHVCDDHGTVPLPPKPRVVQEALFPEHEAGDGSLDLGA